MVYPEEEQNEQNAVQEIWKWFQRRGSEISRGFARAYTWLYDLPYEEGMATSDIIAHTEAGTDVYGPGTTLALGSPASPIDPLYRLAHPSGYDSPYVEAYMEQQDREEVDFFRQVAQASVNLETGAPAALPTIAPETLDTSYVAPVYESVGLDVPTPVPIGTTPTYESVSMPSLDIVEEQEDYGIVPTPDVGAGSDPFIPQGGEEPLVPYYGGTTMTLAPFQDTSPGALGPMGRRALIKTWLAGPPGRRIRFYHFYMGNRKYVGCIKADGSWKQWPVYRPLVVGKTMTDRKARRVANRLDGYAKSAKKILRVLGYKTSRGGRS